MTEIRQNIPISFTGVLVPPYGAALQGLQRVAIPSGATRLMTTQSRWDFVTQQLMMGYTIAGIVFSPPVLSPTSFSIFVPGAAGIWYPIPGPQATWTHVAIWANVADPGIVYEQTLLWRTNS